MMDIMRMMKELEVAGDIDVMPMKYGYAVTINDFGGFNKDWLEIDRVFKLPDLLDEFLSKLETEALEAGGDYYKTYRFENFFIRVGYVSYDI